MLWVTYTIFFLIRFYVGSSSAVALAQFIRSSTKVSIMSITIVFLFLRKNFYTYDDVTLITTMTKMTDYRYTDWHFMFA